MSVLVIIFFKIPITIMTKLIEKGNFLKTIGVILSILANGVCLYAILAANALMDLDTSNQSVIVSVYTYAFDWVKHFVVTVVLVFI